MADAAEAASGHNVPFAVEYESLQGFLDELSNKQKSVSEATGSLRSRIKAIVDEEGFHKGALGQIRSIENMSETARADFLRTFEPMFDAMMEGKWRQQRQDFLDDLENQPDENEE